MAEWLIAPVLKTGIVRNKGLSRVRIPLSPFFRRMDLFIGFDWLGFFRARLYHRAKKKRLDINELKRKEKKIFFQYDLLDSTQYA